MPHRKAKQHWRILLVGGVVGAVIVLALALAAVAVYGRANELNTAIYDQCVRDQVQDAIIEDQLKAALVRVRRSLPAGSAERLYQEQRLKDGIAAVRSDPPCTPPKEVQP